MEKNPRTVMLVDDNFIDNFINTRMIQQLGFAQNISVFNSPLKALKHLRNLDHGHSRTEIPSYIFLDLNMPIMNGFQFLDEFEKLSNGLKNKIKIIILSSAVNPADISRSMSNRHVLTFVSKPLIQVNIEEIEKKIRMEPAA